MTLRFLRAAAMLATGAAMLQFGGCTTGPSATTFDFIQTVLLAITAAGSVVIIQNI